jgi:hypothetical protein
MESSYHVFCLFELEEGICFLKDVDGRLWLPEGEERILELCGLEVFGILWGGMTDHSGSEIRDIYFFRVREWSSRFRIREEETDCTPVFIPDHHVSLWYDLMNEEVQQAVNKYLRLPRHSISSEMPGGIVKG